MINGVIGGRGDMANNLLIPLLKKLGEVRIADKDSSDEQWKKVWETDVIWLSIPRESVSDVLDGVELKSEQLIIDICSIKRGLSDIIAETGALHLSLHPLHGPYIPLNGQKWVIVSDKKAEKNSLVENILSFLKEKGISFIRAESEEEHDFMIGVVLSIPELLTVVIDYLISQYSKDCDQEKPNIKKLIEWSVPASNSLFSSYIHSVASSADWLREELICEAYGSLVESARKTFSSLGEVSCQKITQQLVRQNKTVKKLPLGERKRIQQWIERWFVDSTQKIFSFHKKKQMKPTITVQKYRNKEDVFPVHKGRIKVGVHGIEGCFTHESILRLCEELDIDSSKIDFEYLVESKKVIKAVTGGKIDRGVFGMANSGSGAYISSAHAMGDYQFDIVAIYGMEILQCFISHPSVKDISEIEEVFGHPQAVSQCKRTFAEKYPQIKLTPGEDKDDTALCAKKISEGKLSKTTATLASQLAAKLYNLNILEYGMHHDPFNTTTFLVVKKK